MLDVLAREFLGGGQGKLLLFLHRFPGLHVADDIVHGVDRIDRGGAGAANRIVDGVEMALKAGGISSAE